VNDTWRRVALTAVSALKRLFAAVNPDVLFEVMLELERFAAFGTFEASLTALDQSSRVGRQQR
jgi:hypothetical protein